MCSVGQIRDILLLLEKNPKLLVKRDEVPLCLYFHISYFHIFF